MKTIDSKKMYDLLYKYFTLKSGAKQYQTMQYQTIMHKEGYVCASEGHILAAVNCEYPAELDGKAFLKNGEKFENNLDYLGAIPKSYEKCISLSDQIEDLKIGSKKVYKVKGKAVIDSGIKTEAGERITFKADYLFAGFQLFDLLKENFTIDLILRKNYYYLIFASKSSMTKVLITPKIISEKDESEMSPVFTIEEATNYVPEQKVTKKAWYEKA